MGGCKTINITATVVTIVHKIMLNMILFTNTNVLTTIKQYDNKSTNLSINIYGDGYSIQRELDDYIKDTQNKYVYCGSVRNLNLRPTTPILVNINCIPLGKYYLAQNHTFLNYYYNFVAWEALTTIGNKENLQVDMVKLNFVQSKFTKLNNMKTILIINNKIYHLRGVINLYGVERGDLRYITEHYTGSALKVNGKWETYDDYDTRLKVQTINSTNTTNVEFIVFTL